MDYKKLPLEVRNQNIINISVVLNTIDPSTFPTIYKICMVDFDRFKLINLIHSDLGYKEIKKEDVYNYCVSFEQK